MNNKSKIRPDHPLSKRTSRLLPRLIRFRDAPFYMGMDRNRFNKEVRPHLTQIPIGKQGMSFDRLELDDWIDHYIACNGRPYQKGVKLWDAKKHRASSNEMGSGTLTKQSTGNAFAKALAQIASKKQNSS